MGAVQDKTLAVDKWEKGGCISIRRDSKSIVAGHQFRARARFARRLFIHACPSDRSSLFSLPALRIQAQPPSSLPGSMFDTPCRLTTRRTCSGTLTGWFLI